MVEFCGRTAPLSQEQERINVTYNQLLNHALAMLDEQGPDAAFKLMIQEALQTDKVNQAQIYNFAYCFAALAGKAKEAMNLLQEAVCKEGFWYSYEYLMEDEDLEELRKDPAFERIANICRQRQEEAQSAAEPVLAADDLQPGMPVLLALHGDLRNITLTVPYWQAAKEKGYYLACLQSDEQQFSNAYSWDDEQQAALHLAGSWKTLQEHGVRLETSILAGFDSGARAALYAVLSGAVTPKGLILVAPWLPELEEWSEEFSALKEKGVRVYICCGDADEDCFESSEQLFELLDEEGVEVDFKLCPDLDHDYPENFDQLLGEAIDFVAGE